MDFPHTYRRLIISIYLLLLSFLFSYGQKGLNNVFIENNLDSYISKNIIDWNIPGISIGIIKNDAIIFNNSYGYSNIQEEHLNNSNTIFPLASVTKHITAIALLNELYKKQISVDTNISKYLDSTYTKNQSYINKISFRDLLSHQLPYKKHHGDFLLFESNLSQKEIIRKTFLFKPNNIAKPKSNYNNVGYILAQKLLENISTKSYNKYLDSLFFRPLKMTYTLGSFNKVMTKKHKIKRYLMDNDSIKEIKYKNSDIYLGAGGLYTSLNDYLKWMKLLLNKGIYNQQSIIPAHIINQLFSPLIFEKKRTHPYHNISNQMYGFGLKHYKYQNEEIISHSGGLPGLTTSMVLIPNKKTGIFIMINKSNSGFLIPLMNEILDSILGLPFRNYCHTYKEFYSKYEKSKYSLKKTSYHPDVMKSFLGNYYNDYYGELTINFSNKNQINFEHHPSLTGKIISVDQNKLLYQFDSYLIPIVEITKNGSALDVVFIDSDNSIYKFNKKI